LLGAFYEVNCISLYTRIGNCAIDIWILSSCIRIHGFLQLFVMKIFGK